MMTYTPTNLEILSIPKSMINPLLAENLKEIYNIRAKVLGGKHIQDNLDLDSFNHFTDGRGENLMRKLDEIFGIDYHKKFPRRQYELFNSTYLDAIYITCVLEGTN